MKDSIAASVSRTAKILTAKTLTPKAATSQANEDCQKGDEKMAIAARQRDQAIAPLRVVRPGSGMDRVDTRHCSSSAASSTKGSAWRRLRDSANRACGGRPS